MSCWNSMRDSKSSKRSTLIKLLSLSGSPVEGSSTDFILNRIADAVVETLSGEGRVQKTTISLNDLTYIPCQACGESACCSARRFISTQ
jgi:hypothetical protein